MHAQIKNNIFSGLYSNILVSYKYLLGFCFSFPCKPCETGLGFPGFFGNKPIWQYFLWKNSVLYIVSASYAFVAFLVAGKSNHVQSLHIGWNKPVYRIFSSLKWRRFHIKSILGWWIYITWLYHQTCQAFSNNQIQSVCPRISYNTTFPEALS